MVKNRFVGITIVMIELFILFYKNTGFSSFGGYVDDSLGIMLMPFILLIRGLMLNARTNKAK